MYLPDANGRILVNSPLHTSTITGTRRNPSKYLSQPRHYDISIFQKHILSGFK